MYEVIDGDLSVLHSLILRLLMMNGSHRGEKAIEQKGHQQRCSPSNVLCESHDKVAKPRERNRDTAIFYSVHAVM